MAINKVVYGNDTLIDLTEDTATADDVLNGKTFHLKNGLRATGNASIGDGSLIIKENATTVETFTANQTTDTTLNLGNLAFYNGDTLASGVDPVSIGIDMDLLWANASPTSQFTAQSVSLDLTPYRFVLIVFFAFVSSSHYTTIPTSQFVCRTDAGGQRVNVTNNSIGSRYFAVSGSGIGFSDGAYFTTYNGSTLTNHNSFAVPYKIYGIK